MVNFDDHPSLGLPAAIVWSLKIEHTSRGLPAAIIWLGMYVT